MRPVPTLRRLTISALVGVMAGARVHGIMHQHDHVPDVAQVWYAARAVLSGADPYQLIGPGRPFPWPAPMFYPLPAAVLVTPLAPLSMLIACAVFMGIASACFAWALMERRYWPLLAVVSPAMISAVDGGQWSPLFAAALVVPALSVTLIAKPTIGFAIFAARPSRWALIGGGLLLAVAFTMQPGWLLAWRGALANASLERARGFPYVAPVMMPGGFLVLAALARWRRREARLLAALACMPQTLMLYETIPLFLIPHTGPQSVTFVALSFVTNAITVRARTGVLADDLDRSGQWMILLLFLPALLMVLRRPNEGAAPAWLERAISSWPVWLRGRAIASA